MGTRIEHLKRTRWCIFTRLSSSLFQHYACTQLLFAFYNNIAFFSYFIDKAVAWSLGWPWPWPGFYEARAFESWAKAMAFRPSQASTSLVEALALGGQGGEDVFT